MPPDEIGRVERFLAAFNAIDAHLQVLFAASRPRQDGEEARQSFRSLVDWHARRAPWWPHAEALRLFTSLRNLLVHETLAPRAYPCAPSAANVALIESIRDAFEHPERAVPRWKKPVVVLQAGDALRHALGEMDRGGFGVFPVYETGNRGRLFCGVLCEGDVSRWLAGVVSRGGAVDVERTRVRDVLRAARLERRRTFEWADARATAAEVAHLFHANTFLEAVLVSERGRADEVLVGIVTRADVLGWEGAQ